jgi:hypothetical protein
VRLSQNCLEHRGEITRRGIDDLQYLRGCGLLLQCLARFGQQPRVLYRDDRLRREVLEQCNLLVRERVDLVAVNDHCAQQNIVFEQRHRDLAANSPQLGRLPKRWDSTINFFFPDIGNMDDPLAAFDSPQRSVWIWPYRTGLSRPFDVAWITARCGGMKTFTVVGEEVTMGRLA